MKALVVGGAGFIGSHLVDEILRRGGEATVLDDLSTGKREFLAGALESGRASLIELHVTHEPSCVERLAGIVRGHDVVFHLAANPEARWGLEDTFLDMRQNALTTWAALEAARLAGVPRFVLASSGTVYGDEPEPVSENHGPLFPISLYGASKLAAEALVSAYAHCFRMRNLVMRLGNVVGPRGTHGAALDFIRKLEVDPIRLEVLGDGNQSKPYLHVGDCVAGVLFALEHTSDWLSCFNLGPRDATCVRAIAQAVVEEMGLADRARIEYTGGRQGWPGDVPVSSLVPDKLGALGFEVRRTSDEAVRTAIRELVRERREA